MQKKQIFGLALPLRHLFGFRIISVNTSLFSSNNLRKNLVILKHFLQISKWWYLCSSLSSHSMNFVTMCLMLSSSDKILWHMPYDSPIMLQMSCIVHLQSTTIAMRTAVTFSGLMPVDGCSEWRLSSADVRRSLKCLNQSWASDWPKTSSPNACFNIWCASVAFFPNLKQHFM